MSGYLTTHVLDTARGCPAADLDVALFRIDREARRLVSEARTNADGRTEAPILGRDGFEIGTYELVFHVGAYFDRIGISPEAPRFLDLVPLRIGLSAAVHYHVPLLLSPFGYSTYRGS